MKINLKQLNQKVNERNGIISLLSLKLTNTLLKFKRNIKNELNLNYFGHKYNYFKTNSNVDFENQIVDTKTNQEIKSDFAICNYQSSLNIYATDESIKRINLFFNKIDENIYAFHDLFEFIFNYCNKYDYYLRIIYESADFEIFKDFLKNNKIILPDNVNFLNLKPDNYLQIGSNEMYICTSWEVSKSLINTRCINSIIYFYFDDLSLNNNFEQYKSSKICSENNIVILNDDLNKLIELNNYLHDYEK